MSNPHPNQVRGDRHWKWVDGVRVSSAGYIFESSPNHPRRSKGRWVQQHILVAEKALGKYLPAKAVVHHVDENKANNANTNLVICQDEAYHRHIHARQRIVRAGGSPSTHKVCNGCHGLLLRTDFTKRERSYDGLYEICRPCTTKQKRQYKERLAQ